MTYSIVRSLSGIRLHSCEDNMMIFSWVKIFVCVSFFQLPIGTYRGHQTGPEELKRVPAEDNVSQVEFYPQIVELAAK